MFRYDIINALIKKHNYMSYLEIGLSHGETFERVQCPVKVSVDIAGNPTHKMTSDEFFAQNKTVYDIIFVDGDHSTAQARRDIENALRWCDYDGTVVIHDCNPPLAEHATDEYTGGCWMGGVWKSIATLRTRPWLVVYTVDTDCGVAVVRTGAQDPLTPVDDLTFEYLDEHREKLLNLITVEEFVSSL